MGIDPGCHDLKFVAKVTSHSETSFGAKCVGSKMAVESFGLPHNHSYGGTEAGTGQNFGGTGYIPVIPTYFLGCFPFELVFYCAYSTRGMKAGE